MKELKKKVANWIWYFVKEHHTCDCYWINDTWTQSKPCSLCGKTQTRPMAESVRREITEHLKRKLKKS